jgi:hypothetical protein
VITFTSPLDRLMAKVSPEALTGCWLWDAKVGDNGYGQFWLDGETVGAHVASWRLHRGPTLGLFVLHHCDLPCCVRPEHLFLGTSAENMADMARKGRAAGLRRQGMAHPLARDVDEQQVRALAAKGLSQRQIASDVGISQALVSGIVNRNRWSASC